MNEHLRDRILRKLESLSDERGYQVLDYAEFLESRYAERESPTRMSALWLQSIRPLRLGVAGSVSRCPQMPLSALM